jgi:hypothetical protein
MRRRDVRRNAQLAALSLLSTLILTACGGGGGGSDDASAESERSGPAAPLPGAQGGGSDDAAAEAERLRRKAASTTTSTTPTTNTPSTSTTTPTTISDSAAPPMDDGSVWPPAFRALSSSACSSRLIGSNKTYDVGPGKTYTELNQVPWLSLQAGDVVNIHYRSTPYRTVIGLRAQGTAAKPVYINGVTDANCNLPVLDAEGATMADDAKAAHFGSYGQLSDGTWSDGIQGLGIFLIYWQGNEVMPTGQTPRYDYLPQFITIQNLKMMNANHNVTFTNGNNVAKAYQGGASAIYAVRVRHLTVENCEITANDNGIFTNSRGTSVNDYTSNVIVRRSKIHLNGNPVQSTEHNLYLQGRRSLVEGNFLGQAYGGSTYKDRGSATVVRYNYIQASARAIDLVETEEEYVTSVRDDPLYDYAWVYGNIILNDINLPLSNTNDRLSGRPIHFGHDKNSAKTRKGVLFFYGNTYVHRSSCLPGGNCYYQSSVFQVGGNDDQYPDINARVEAGGNIFWADDGTTGWAFLASSRVGRVVLRGANYVPENRNLPDSYSNTQVSNGTGWTATNTPMVDTSAATLFIGDTRKNPPKLDATTMAPLTGSPALDAGITGPSFTPSGAAADNLTLIGEYTYPRGVKNRILKGSAFDLGAIEQP